MDPSTLETQAFPDAEPMAAAMCLMTQPTLDLSSIAAEVEMELPPATMKPNSESALENLSPPAMPDLPAVVETPALETSCLEAPVTCGQAVPIPEEIQEEACHKPASEPSSDTPEPIEPAHTPKPTEPANATKPIIEPAQAAPTEKPATRQSVLDYQARKLHVLLCRICVCLGVMLYTH